MKRALGLGLTVGLLMTGCGETQMSSTSTLPGTDPLYVRVPEVDVDRSFAERTGFIRDHIRGGDYAFGYLAPWAYAHLPPSVRDRVDVLDEDAFRTGRFDPETFEILSKPAPVTANGDAEDYHDYDALTSELQLVASEHPHLVEVTSAGHSVEGRELWLVKISDHAVTEENEPKLLYIANMHGDEVVGRELMIYLVRLLVDDYGRDSRITNLVDHAQIYIMPSMNPDGFENRSRWNANGIDLNRNFPDFTSDPRDTPDGRQPEVKAVMELHAEHHFVAALNFHGGEVCFNMPWDTKANGSRDHRFGDDDLMRQIGRTYADQNPTMTSNDSDPFDKGLTYGYEWYEVNGGMQDWANYYQRSFHATIELSHTKWPGAEDLPNYWNENRESLLRYLEQGMEGLHLEVVDQTGNMVEKVWVEVSSANRPIDFDGGYVNRPTLPGEQQVTLSAPGFESVTMSLSPWRFRDDFIRVVLPSK